MVCIPALPSYVDINVLDHAAIRSLVVATYRRIRVYKSLQSTGFTGFASKTIILENLTDPARTHDRNLLLFYRLLPSLEFPIIADCDILEVYNILQGVRAWSFSPSNRGMVPVGAKLVASAVEELSRNSFRLVVVSRIGISTMLVTPGFMIFILIRSV